MLIPFVDPQTNLILQSAEVSHRLGTENVLHGNPQYDRTLVADECEPRVGADMLLDVQPIRGFSSGIVHDQDHRLYLPNPGGEVAALNTLDDRLAIGNSAQFIGCLQLQEYETWLRLPTTVQGEQKQIDAVRSRAGLARRRSRTATPGVRRDSHSGLR